MVRELIKVDVGVFCLQFRVFDDCSDVAAVTEILQENYLDLISGPSSQLEAKYFPFFSFFFDLGVGKDSGHIQYLYGSC